MMFKLKKSTFVFSLFLCLCFVFQCVPLALSSDATDKMNYASGTSANIMDILEIVSQLGNKTCTTNETAYLNANYAELQVKYTAGVPQENVILTAISGTSVRVDATEYSYTADNGTLVVWKPASASYKQKTVTLNYDKANGVYSGTMTDVPADDDFYVNIRYVAELSVPSEVYNEVVNAAYEVGKTNLAIEIAYEKRFETYTKQLTAYYQYLAAEAQYSADFEQYLTDQENYQNWIIKKADYDAYVIKKKAYDDNEQLKKDYSTLKQNYDNYVVQKQLVSECMAKFDDVYVSKSDLGTDMAYMITGTGLKIVYERLDEVKNSDEAMFNLYFGSCADEFTNAENMLYILTPLLVEYSKLTSDQAKFEWYKKNYATYKEALHSLYESMYTIRNNKSFAYAMSIANLTDSQIEKVKNFVVDLGIYDNALIDPSSLSWPKTVKEPAVPDYTMVEPLPVENPGMMEEPVAPTSPTAVTHPGAAPAKPDMSAMNTALMEEVRSGKLKEYAIVKTSVTVKEDIIVPLKSQTDHPVVTFMDSDASTVLARVEWKESPDIASIVPTYPADASCDYTFSGWVTSDGQAADFSNVTSNIVVYPIFDKTPKIFNITWVVDGSVTSEKYEYGTLPVFKGDATRPADSGGKYIFSGWDKEVVPVTEDATYVAQFERSTAAYTITFVIGSRTFEVNTAEGTVPVCTADPQAVLDEDNSLTTGKCTKFIGWDKEIAPASCETVYTARTEVTWAVPVNSGSSEIELGATVEKNASGWLVSIKSDDCTAEMSYILSRALRENAATTVTFASGSCVVFPATFTAGGNIGESVVLTLHETAAGDSYACSMTLRDGENNRIDAAGVKINFTFDTQGKSYEAYSSSDGTNYEKCSFYASGTENCYTFICASDTVSFRLTEADHTIEKTTYTIRFYSEGELINTQLVEAGQTVVAPTPEKASDSQYYYTFIGWTPTFVSVASGNVDYEAIFQKDLIHIGLPTIIIILYIFIGLILAAIVFFIVRLIVKKSKKRMPPKKDSGKKPEIDEADERMLNTDTFGDTLNFSLSTAPADSEKQGQGPENAPKHAKNHRENAVKTSSKSKKATSSEKKPFHAIRDWFERLKSQV